MFKPGIVEDCPLTGNHQELKLRVGGEHKYVSKEAEIKQETGRQNKSSVILPKRFTLTTEIEELNISDTKGYVAVVHIDGNGLGHSWD